MFTGGYYIVDFSNVSINITADDDSASIKFDKNIISYLKSADKPVMITNLHINHHSAGEVAVSGFALKTLNAGTISYNMGMCVVSISGDDTLLISVDLAD